MSRRRAGRLPRFARLLRDGEEPSFAERCRADGGPEPSDGDELADRCLEQDTCLRGHTSSCLRLSAAWHAGSEVPASRSCTVFFDWYPCRADRGEGCERTLEPDVGGGDEGG